MFQSKNNNYISKKFAPADIFAGVILIHIEYKYTKRRVYNTDSFCGIINLRR